MPSELISAEVPEEIKPWSDQDRNLILAWDSVNSTTLMTCPWKFKLQIIEGWVPKKMAPPLKFGILFHSAVEFYERRRAEGLSFQDSLHEAVKNTLKASRDFLGDSDGKALRTRFTLVRALIWYADKYKDDVYRTMILADGRPAVELSFRIALPLISPDGTPYIFCGHIDRVSRAPESEVLINDYKTSGTTLTPHFFKKFDSSWQMSGYTFAGMTLLPEAPAGVMIEGIQLAVGFTRSARGFTFRNEAQIEEWLEDFLYWIKLAEKFAQDNYWPMNRQSCDLYGGCQFKNVCDRSPNVRKEWLQADFKQDPWNPLINRGE